MFKDFSKIISAEILENELETKTLQPEKNTKKKFSKMECAKIN